MTDKPKLPKAFSVQSDNEGIIIFSMTNVDARRRGASCLDEEFGDVSCRRAPYADKYLWLGRVPRKALVEEFGWYQECSYCSYHVDEDDSERVWHGDGLYCSSECLARRLNSDMDYAREAREREAAEREAVERAKIKFPGASHFSAISVYRNGIVVRFRFPGGKWPATWRIDESTVSGDREDKEALQAFIDSTKGGEK